MEAKETVPVKTQQNNVDDTAEVPLGVADGRKHNDEEAVVQNITTENETDAAFPTMYTGSAAKGTSRSRPGRPKGSHNTKYGLLARVVAVERWEENVYPGGRY